MDSVGIVKTPDAIPTITEGEKSVTTASVLFHKFLISTFVCFNTRPDWATAKGILGDAKFLSRLMEYDKVRIPKVLKVKGISLCK